MQLIAWSSLLIVEIILHNFHKNSLIEFWHQYLIIALISIAIVRLLILAVLAKNVTIKSGSDWMKFLLLSIFNPLKTDFMEVLCLGIKTGEEPPNES